MFFVSFIYEKITIFIENLNFIIQQTRHILKLFFNMLGMCVYAIIFYQASSFISLQNLRNIKLVKHKLKIIESCNDCKFSLRKFPAKSVLSSPLHLQ